MKRTVLAALIVLSILLASCMTAQITEETVADGITKDQARMLQATAQIALERHNLKDDTSSLLEDWTFARQDYPEPTKFIVTTTPAQGRIKFIFEWSGNDGDDLILRYLLYAGKEYVKD